MKMREDFIPVCVMSFTPAPCLLWRTSFFLKKSLPFVLSFFEEREAVWSAVDFSTGWGWPPDLLFTGKSVPQAPGGVAPRPLIYREQRTAGHRGGGGPPPHYLPGTAYLNWGGERRGASKANSEIYIRRINEFANLHEGGRDEN